VAYTFLDKMKIIDLTDLEGYWQPVRSAILTTAGHYLRQGSLPMFLSDFVCLFVCLSVSQKD